MTSNADPSTPVQTKAKEPAFLRVLNSNQSTVNTPSPALVHNRVEYFEGLGSGRKRKAPCDDASEEQENRECRATPALAAATISPGVVSDTRNKLLSRQSLESSCHSTAELEKITPGSVRKSIERWSKGSPLEDQTGTSPACKRQKLAASFHQVGEEQLGDSRIPPKEETAKDISQPHEQTEEEVAKAVANPHEQAEEETANAVAKPHVKARKSDFLSVAWEDDSMTPGEFTGNENLSASESASGMQHCEATSPTVSQWVPSQAPEATKSQASTQGSASKDTPLDPERVPTNVNPPSPPAEDSVPGAAVAQWEPGKARTTNPNVRTGSSTGKGPVIHNDLKIDLEADANDPPSPQPGPPYGLGSEPGTTTVPEGEEAAAAMPGGADVTVVQWMPSKVHTQPAEVPADAIDLANLPSERASGATDATPGKEEEPSSKHDGHLPLTRSLDCSTRSGKKRRNKNQLLC